MAQAQTAQFVFIDNAGRKIVIHGFFSGYNQRPLLRFLNSARGWRDRITLHDLAPRTTPPVRWESELYSHAACSAICKNKSSEIDQSYFSHTSDWHCCLSNFENFRRKESSWTYSKYMERTGCLAFTVEQDSIKSGPSMRLKHLEIVLHLMRTRIA